MNVLLLGSGGREHAFSLKISQSPELNKLFIAPGNAGTALHGTNVDLSPTNLEQVYQFCVENQIDLVVPGNEDPLVAGLVDYIEEKSTAGGLKMGVAGPSEWCARLEGSKDFAKAFMKKYEIPTAKYESFRLGDLESASAFMKTLEPPYVLKADGLAAGKGVIITESLEEAEAVLKEMTDGSKFGKAGEVVVIEEFLKGIELSVFAVSDGDSWQILGSAKDYKRIFDGDQGPNTGGMGAISPVPFADAAFMEKVISRIVKPTFDGLKAEGHPYKGFLFVGLMNVAGDPMVIEYNVRMGDPETEAIFPRLNTPMLDMLTAIAKGNLSTVKIELKEETAATVFLVSGGYPGDIEKGKTIQIPATYQWQTADSNKQWLFHAGTKMQGDDVVTNGGRVIAITSLGKDIADALIRSNEMAQTVEFEGKFHRKDIGLDLLNY